MPNIQLWSGVAATWVGVLSAVIGGAIAVSTYVHDVSGRVSGRQATALREIGAFQQTPLLAARASILEAARGADVSWLAPETIQCIKTALVSYQAAQRTRRVECEPDEPSWAVSGERQVLAGDLAAILASRTPSEILAVARAAAEELTPANRRPADAHAALPRSSLGAERVALLQTAYASAARAQQVKISETVLSSSAISVAAVLDFFDSTADCADLRLCDRAVVENGLKRYARTYFYFLEPYIRAQRSQFADPSVGRGLERIARQAGYERMLALPDSLPLVRLDRGTPGFRLSEPIARGPERPGIAG